MAPDPLIVQFENRLRKRFRHLQRWAKREGIDAFRVYDRDIPELAFAVDVYGPKVLLQKYVRDPEADAELDTLDEFALAVARATEHSRDAVVVKVRRKLNRREEQHEKHETYGNDFVVEECGARLWVNLNPYLDTGLFLDHRDTRQWVRKLAGGKRLLNLFCYTGSFTVAAALGGALESTSVDLSNTYLAWARRNFALNALDENKHRVERADVLEWLQDAVKRTLKFDLIVLDPPAFSSSKAMTEVLDIQRDHSSLVENCMSLLAREGDLIFSTNLRSFKLDSALMTRFDIEDWTAKSIPMDFRNQRIHRCWRIRHKNAA